MVDFHVLIPARYASVRFPGKLMMLLGEKSVLQRVYEQALLAKPQSITIVTDDQRIFDHARSWGASVFLSQQLHHSGTDRIAEYVCHGGYKANDIIVNLQGDEPLISPDLIQQVAVVLQNCHSPVATLSAPLPVNINHYDFNIVKVICNYTRQALYFSRSLIPGHKAVEDIILVPERHIGLYAYRAEFLQLWQTLPVCDLERHESLEQLRVLWYGYQIQVGYACCAPSQDINTPEDLAKAKLLLNL